MSTPAHTHKMTSHNQKGWAEYLRFITPILVTICLFLLSNINSKVDDISDKLFKHLTNDEMHTPKSIAVSKAEFMVYQQMNQQQIEGFRSDFNIRFSNLTKSIDSALDALGKNGKH